MQYETSCYEALCRHMYVNWALLFDRVVELERIVEALTQTHAKHPYLRCQIKEGAKFGEMTLIEKDSLTPVVIAKEGKVTRESVNRYLEECATLFENVPSIVDTVHYTYYSDKCRSALIGCFCHSCADANSALHVASDVLTFLDAPILPAPASLPFLSVQKEIILDESETHAARYADQTLPVWVAPTRLREGDASIQPFYRTKQLLLSPDTMNSILGACRSHDCAFQSFLWTSVALAQMRLFHRSLPVSLRFGTPVTTIGRATFRHPISRDDLVVGAFSVFVQKELQGDDSFWSLCKQLHDALKEEIRLGKQMNDFFAVCRDLDFKQLPPASFNACTLGTTDLKRQYKHFSLDGLYLLPGATRSPQMGGMNLHAFTVPEMGCLLNLTYCYPFFSPSDVDAYAADIRRVMDMVVSRDPSLQSIADQLSG